MIQHFIVVAYRNIVKRKVYSLINVLGLAIGMTCCLLITQFIINELSFDRYHKNGDRIFRVVHAYHDPASEVLPGPDEYQVWGIAPVGPALLSAYPEIESLVQFTSPNTLLLQNGDKRLQQENTVYMDSTAFNVFSWKMISGDPHTALKDPATIVLTRTVAEKLFGNEDPVGKSLRVENTELYKVTGVMEDVPPNSHFDFSALISMSTFRRLRPEIFDAWGYVDFYTYFRAREGTTISSLSARVPGLLKRYSPDPGFTMGFERLHDAYLHSKAGRQPGVTGSLANVYIFGVAAIFILTIACINFMNLSTARSMERAREVGVRKALGAQKNSLIRQFLAESILLSIAALIIALLLSRVAQPLISSLSGKTFSLSAFFNTKMLILVTAAAVITGVLAGIYPALFLSRYRTIAVLKSTRSGAAGGNILRKSLVVFQFTLSIALIAGTGIVYSQLTYLQNHELGFNKEQMLVIDFAGDVEAQQKIATIKHRIEQHPHVISASSSRAIPGEFLPNAYTEIQGPTGEMVPRGPLIYEIDDDFIQDYGIEMVAGRPYSKDFPSDTLHSLIINEAATRMFGYADPRQVIGKKFSQWGREGTVIGVVKDFNFRSLHQRVEPLTLRFAESYALNYLSVRLKHANAKRTIADLKKSWEDLVPHRPFQYRFLDESFNRHYQSDVNFGRIFSLFAALAILIASLGLFGLAAFTAGQRTKEIGIRKVLGSSVSGIVTLITKDFIKLVVLAIFISVPLCWYAMNKWLNDFPYRVDIDPIIFVKAGFVAVLVAAATISWQSIKAAIANPVNSLRDE